MSLSAARLALFCAMMLAEAACICAMERFICESDALDDLDHKRTKASGQRSGCGTNGGTTRTRKDDREHAAAARGQVPLTIH